MFFKGILNCYSILNGIVFYMYFGIYIFPDYVSSNIFKFP